MKRKIAMFLKSMAKEIIKKMTKKAAKIATDKIVEIIASLLAFTKEHFEDVKEFFEELLSKLF
jgi:hemerythrin